MSNSDNLLDKLRQNRHRTTVPSRNDALFVPQNEEEAQQEDGSQLTIEQLKERLSKYPRTRRRSGIVLEEDLDRQLTQFCKENQVTVETFLEAAWQLSQADPGWLAQVIAEAKRRYASRKEAGRLRRLITSLTSINM